MLLSTKGEFWYHSAGASWQSQRVFLETLTLPKDEAISSLIQSISLEGSLRVARFQTCSLDG